MRWLSSLLLLSWVLCGSLYGQTFVVTGEGSSAIAITNRLDVIESQTASLQRDVAELKQIMLAMSVKPQPTAIDAPSPVKPVAARTQSEVSAEQHLLSVHGISVSGMSLQEMERIHDDAHGGTGYHFPGMISLNTAIPVRQTIRYSGSSNCPNGVCPTRTTSRFRFFRR